MSPSLPRAGAAGGRIKGAAIAEFLRWYGRAVDADRLSSAAIALRGAVGDALDPAHPTLGIIASSWYPASTIHALLDELVREHDEHQRHDLAQRGAVAVMDATLRGVFRAVFEMMTTPSRYAKLSGLLWKVYYDSGEFRVTMAGPNKAVCTIRDWRTHHPFICELNWGAARAIYQAMGCRGVRVVRTDCVDTGSAECRFVSTWER